MTCRRRSDVHTAIVSRHCRHEVLIVLTDRLILQSFTVRGLRRVHRVPLTLSRVVLTVPLIGAVAADQTGLEDVLSIYRRFRDRDGPMARLCSLALRARQIVLHRRVHSAGALVTHLLGCDNVRLA